MNCPVSSVDCVETYADHGGCLSVVQVIAGLDSSHGGPSYSVPRLCSALAAAGLSTSLMSVAESGGASSAAMHDDYRDYRFVWDAARVPVLRGLRKSSALTAALRKIASSTSLVHNHGLWLLPNMAAGWQATRAQKPLVVSPRGMLSEAALTFSPWKKRAVWNLAQRSVLRNAACLHATSDAEYREIRARGLNKPVAVIPNGVDVPALNCNAVQPTDRQRTVLSLGRLHPKKNLANLVYAWADLEARFPEWRLQIAGPNEFRHDQELRGLASSLGLVRVSIEGPVYGEEKFAAYRRADVFVLPTRNENFGLTVAESLAAGTPVISTKGAPWGRLDAEGCGWWIEHGIAPLTAALAKAMAMPHDSLKAMGARGRVWMQRDFSWEAVASEMIGVYRWIVRGAEVPSVVRFD